MARTNSRPSVKYRARNDNCLVRKVRVEQVHGLFMPEASIHGNQFIIQEIGPDVKDLEPGDVVFVAGQIGVDVGEIPNDPNLLVCSQKNIKVVMKPVTEEIH